MAEVLAREENLRAGFEERQETFLQPNDVSVPVGRGAPRREHVRFHRR